MSCACTSCAIMIILRGWPSLEGRLWLLIILIKLLLCLSQSQHTTQSRGRDRAARGRSDRQIHGCTHRILESPLERSESIISMKSLVGQPVVAPALGPSPGTPGPREARARPDAAAPTALSCVLPASCPRTSNFCLRRDPLQFQAHGLAVRASRSFSSKQETGQRKMIASMSSK